MTEQQRACSVCRRGEPPVCPRCTDRIADQLTAVPALVEALPYALVPAQGGSGERVSATREAPLPASLDALSMLAGGSDEARCCFIPKVRVWSTVVEWVDYRGVVHARTVWERELVTDERGRPVMTLADDQTGTIPVGAWLAGWVGDWRRSFGHSTRSLVRASVAEAPSAPDFDAARRMLGLGPALPYTSRPADPLADEWAARWPQTTPVEMLNQWKYLLNFLPHACESYPRMGDFAASLRTLVGALRQATGDIEDLEYLGRCPETLTDRDSGVASICGASLWHDSQHATITCPRCRAETGRERQLWLARRILDVWPLDRRRRYPRGLIEALRLPTCHCGVRVSVEWIDATERRDAERFWRVGKVNCPMCNQEARI